MRLILINNTDEDLTEAHILGRTIFEGNKSIINKDKTIKKEVILIKDIKKAALCW